MSAGAFEAGERFVACPCRAGVEDKSFSACVAGNGGFVDGNDTADFVELLDGDVVEGGVFAGAEVVEGEGEAGSCFVSGVEDIDDADLGGFTGDDEGVGEDRCPAGDPMMDLDGSFNLCFVRTWTKRPFLTEASCRAAYFAEPRRVSCFMKFASTRSECFTSASASGRQMTFSGSELSEWMVSSLRKMNFATGLSRPVEREMTSSVLCCGLKSAFRSGKFSCLMFAKRHCSSPRLGVGMDS